MHLYYTGEEGNPYVTFTKDDKTIGATIATFDDIVTRIQNKDFRMESRPTKLCPDCDMRQFCGAGSLGSKYRKSTKTT